VPNPLRAEFVTHILQNGQMWGTLLVSTVDESKKKAAFRGG